MLDGDLGQGFHDSDIEVKFLDLQLKALESRRQNILKFTKSTIRSLCTPYSSYLKGNIGGSESAARGARVDCER